LVRQEALGAKTQASEEIGKPGHQFALGRLTAYYEVSAGWLRCDQFVNNPLPNRG